MLSSPPSRMRQEDGYQFDARAFELGTFEGRKKGRVRPLTFRASDCTDDCTNNEGFLRV